MLVHLSIRDLAVVEALELEFDGGLTVLTGETGAGKSILLTALGLALGDRADSGFIRPGANRAEINLGFDVADSPAARQWLEDHDLGHHGDCLVRRIVNADGRSKAYINNRPVTLQALQELGAGLVEIHGQHAHVQLLKPQEQRRLLDAAADNGELLTKIEGLYKRWRVLRDELAQSENAARDRVAREELLRYQIDELEQHDIADLDYKALIEEHTLQANMGKILSTGQAQLEALYEDETRSVNSQLAQAVHALADLGQLAPELLEPLVMLKEAQVQVKEAALQLRRQLDRLEADPARFDWLENRLGDLHRLARKHRVRPEALPEHLDALAEELAQITQGSEMAEAAKLEFEQIAIEYAGLAAILSERRHAAALELQDKISAAIRELGMPQGRLLMEVRPMAGKEPAPHGWDQVEFLVSANPGLPPRPLARVASGGELSRISLAIQVAATDSKTVPSLIFDEVDTGIGGGIAEIVGQKLRMLGQQGRQVFCVTHLPQVAVQGHHHLLVEKSSGGGVTQSTVRQLDGQERTREIARMLGGVRLTRQTLAHAEEMLGLQGSGEG
ncbi:DNA repair protein RecN (Recombination protein N) [Methylomagnum ishizawai]|uniref:DNA repair protein RecN n=1 Tax=Methylomagnum ishizawai TaxID=1760988 RepID=A0A1Y6D8Z1_9GAMM|nr:DNA repair protein RecN [Methylomagnum ishizawai]SMF96235.1 DNA repair protein RecN (Recombination protein N) [Methylomagnum ishizawai]